MNSRDIRQKFIEYFQSKEHTSVKSSSLVPDGDATLLFNNAGMNQFKNTFLGIEKRDYSRATSSQKCVRAGGKHNDLENVGHTARHHTFFEMLGNFSFGDYFKEDAIRYAWEFLTEVMQIPKEKLYVTVFETDDEAAEIWKKVAGVKEKDISRFGEKDNFWRMGDTGPCGPCTEIFYDHGPEKSGCENPKTCKVGCECDRFVEIWNLVFMQYLEEPKGTLNPLPKPSVDTGMGLERLAALMQGTNLNYDTDLFQDIIQVAVDKTGIKYGQDEKMSAAMRVLADHARATAFLIADGVLPANDGRGYVLRRIMRRAIRYGRTLSTETSLLPAMVNAVIIKMDDFYPELLQQKTLIEKTVETEEERFLTTLDQGTQLLEKALKYLKEKNQSKVPGETVFRLYDTYGFPADLTRIMAEEAGFTVDEKEFQTHMEKARELARSSWKGEAITSDAAHLLELGQTNGETLFTGYDSLYSKSNVNILSNGTKEVTSLEAGNRGIIFISETSFYAESGGQIGDTGEILSCSAKARVMDCTKHGSSHALHIDMIDGTLKKGDEIEMSVTGSTRRATVANHSATHLMHAALREVLGDHVTQAGSLVESTRLRFDFTHGHPMTQEEIEKVEALVNNEISSAVEVESSLMSYDSAIEAGAMALFGEKYGDEVRVIKMDKFSTELCGGTHVSNTSDIRLFKVVSESGVSSGVRRIEALTGDMALDYLMKQARENIHNRQEVGIKENWTQYLGLEEKKSKSSIQSATDWIEASKTEKKSLEKQIKQMQISNIDYKKIVDEAKVIGTRKLAIARIPVDDRKLLGDITTRIKDNLKSGAILVVGEGEKSSPIMIACTKDLIADGVKAGDLLKDFTSLLGGKGGGKPDLAQGGASDLSKLSQAIDSLARKLG
ncbi:MAG: alanine--tRNA ligase [Bdellovibrionales bacterium]